MADTVNQDYVKAGLDCLKWERGIVSFIVGGTEGDWSEAVPASPKAKELTSTLASKGLDPKGPSFAPVIQKIFEQAPKSYRPEVIPTAQDDRFACITL